MKIKLLILIILTLPFRSLLAQGNEGLSQEMIVNILILSVGILVVGIVFKLLAVFNKLVKEKEEEILEKHNLTEK